MTIEADLRAAADRAHADSLLLHEIVHGDAQTTVNTENGPVKSVAKVIVDVEASVDGHMTDITQAVDATNTAQRQSFKYAVMPGRYEVQLQRLDTKDA